MSRNEFIVTTAVILFAAFLLGWFASWLINRLTRVTRADLNELEAMAQQLHDSEEAREKAIQQLEDRESELVAKLSSTRSELDATREQLTESQTEIEELRDYINRKLARQK
ncbi:hypothetical protein [Paracoccus sulfuroxidans]|uniref:Uncharacterized protein n=1 Tax=Paracoccus sulfuroxidans TaxID=384678 RepID=A0A562NQK1_9RHOB|nr:hypothetical protein [Paracoccus sulfuroxidans]TWI34465.1 hypothetical protein IQ24_01983 [Paracoccus sulfuroxidans]